MVTRSGPSRPARVQGSHGCIGASNMHRKRTSFERFSKRPTTIRAEFCSRLDFAQIVAPHRAVTHT